MEQSNYHRMLIKYKNKYRRVNIKNNDRCQNCRLELAFFCFLQPGFVGIIHSGILMNGNEISTVK